MGEMRTFLSRGVSAMILKIFTNSPFIHYGIDFLCAALYTSHGFQVLGKHRDTLRNWLTRRSRSWYPDTVISIERTSRSSSDSNSDSIVEWKRNQTWPLDSSAQSIVKWLPRVRELVLTWNTCHPQKSSWNIAVKGAVVSLTHIYLPILRGSPRGGMNNS